MASNERQSGVQHLGKIVAIVVALLVIISVIMVVTMFGTDSSTRKLLQEQVAHPGNLGLKYENWQQTPKTGFLEKKRPPFVSYEVLPTDVVSGTQESDYRQINAKLMGELKSKFQKLGWTQYDSGVTRDSWAATKRDVAGEQLFLVIQPLANAAQTKSAGLRVYLSYF